MTTPTQLEMDFHKDMLAIYRSAKEECHYNATRFLQMVANDGGLKTAKKLLPKNEPSDGFTELWKYGKPDLTVENLMLGNEDQGLLNNEEIKTTQERLNAHGYRKT